MWDIIFEAIIGLAVWILMVWFTLKLIDDWKSKKQRRRYDDGEDLGRRKESDGQGSPERGSKRDRNSNGRKRKIQDAVEHAKRELLSDGASGGDSKD